MKTTFFSLVLRNQESGHSLGRCLWLLVSHKAVIKVSPRAACISNSLMWLLAGLSSSMAVNWKRQFFATGQGQLTTWQPASVRVRKEKGCPRQKPLSFCTQISRGTSHQLRHILFTRSYHSVQANSRIAQEHESQDAGITGGRLRGYPPQLLRSAPLSLSPSVWLCYSLEIQLGILSVNTVEILLAFQLSSPSPHLG